MVETDREESAEGGGIFGMCKWQVASEKMRELRGLAAYTTHIQHAYCLSIKGENMVAVRLQLLLFATTS